MDILQLIVSILFGGGGVVGLVSILRARRAKERGIPDTEERAVSAGPSWDALTTHYQKELETLRGDLKNELEGERRRITRLERLRELDSQYIDALESHIWQGKPPPPPPRPQYPTTEDHTQ